jgi:hypothetical protein
MREYDNHLSALFFMLTVCLAKNNCRLWAELASQNNPRHGYQPDKQSKIKVALTKAKLKKVAYSGQSIY